MQQRVKQFCAFLLAGLLCGAASLPCVAEESYSVEAIKKLDKQIDYVSLGDKSLAGKVDIYLSHENYITHKDWDQVAKDFAKVARGVFASPQAQTLTYLDRYSESQTQIFRYLRLTLTRNKLPENWQKASDAKLLASAQMQIQDLALGEKLCAYYDKNSGALSADLKENACKNTTAPPFLSLPPMTAEEMAAERAATPKSNYVP